MRQSNITPSNMCDPEHKCECPAEGWADLAVAEIKRLGDGWSQANSDLLTANIALAELEGLRAWREDTLRALGDWHRLGDALLKLTPGRIGADISQHLQKEIPGLVANLEGRIEGHRTVIEDLRQRLSEVEQENKDFRNWGIIEVAIRNVNVSSYMDDWEKRAEAAEAKLTEAERYAAVQQMQREQSDRFHAGLMDAFKRAGVAIPDGPVPEGKSLGVWMVDILSGRLSALQTALAGFNPKEASPIQHDGPCSFWRSKSKKRCNCRVKEIATLLRETGSEQPCA